MIIEYVAIREGVIYFKKILIKKRIKFFKQFKWVTVLLDKQLLTHIRDLAICDYHLF